MDSFIHFFEALTPTILPFEVEAIDINKKNYGIFPIHYYEYYSKLSPVKKLVSDFDLMGSSDIESIHSSEDEDSDEVDDEVDDDIQGGISELMKKYGRYAAARKEWKNWIESTLNFIVQGLKCLIVSPGFVNYHLLKIWHS